MGVKKALRLEKGTQTKESQIERLVPADMFVQMRVTGCQIKGIIQWIVFNYLILFNLKERETIQVTVDDGAAAQMSSLSEEGISEQYMAINTFSELLTVIFQSNEPFLWTIHGYDAELLFFYF